MGEVGQLKGRLSSIHPALTCRRQAGLETADEDRIGPGAIAQAVVGERPVCTGVGVAGMEPDRCGVVADGFHVEVLDQVRARGRLCS